MPCSIWRHSHLIYVNNYGDYELMGRTVDDAAGEAFDKIARALGLGYPGGPLIDKAAKLGNESSIAFPIAHIRIKTCLLVSADLNHLF